ncbi:MAG: hypothetical protein QOI99_1531 [Actinomycetota bacterium]|jgi:hypothetical protein|nr:hypothetical protein [Actinomycetota bacterium]
MKPLRTGLGVGLLAGAAGAANKLVRDWRAGTLDRGAATPRVVTGPIHKAVTGPITKAVAGPITKAVTEAVAKVDGISTGSSPRADKRADAGDDGRRAAASESLRGRRASRRATANRPPWVVAPAPTGAVRTPASTRPTPSGPRKAPAPAPRPPVSAKSVGTTVGKYAVKRVGKVVGKVAADRIGKALEVVEVLESLVASVSEPATKPDMTLAGPGATMQPLPASSVLASIPARPGLSPTPPTDDADPSADGGGPPAARASAPPRGTLVSVRKFERGPRVVVGRSVSPPAGADAPGTDAIPEVVPDVAPDVPAPAGGDASAPVEPVVQAAVEAVAEAVEEAVEAAAAEPSASPTSPPSPASRRATAKAKAAPAKRAKKARSSANPTPKGAATKSAPKADAGSKADVAPKPRPAKADAGPRADVAPKSHPAKADAPPATARAARKSPAAKARGARKSPAGKASPAKPTTGNPPVGGGTP